MDSRKLVLWTSGERAGSGEGGLLRAERGRGSSTAGGEVNTSSAEEEPAGGGGGRRSGGGRRRGEFGETEDG